jgi:hypothetical protein
VEWLPDNNLAVFLLDQTSELDLKAIHAVYCQKDPRVEKASMTRE